MKATTYLLLTTFKNRLKLLIKNPVKFIFVLLFVIFMVGSIILSLFIPIKDRDPRNLKELYLIIFALFTFIFYGSSFNGLRSGATFFSMPDVNLLFSAPIKPKTILHYGLLKQLGTSLFVGIFLVFQYSWLRSSYHLNVISFFAILISYSIVIFISQLCALVIYSYTSFNNKRRSIIKILLYLFVLPPFIYAIYLLFKYYPNLQAIIANVKTIFLMAIPFAGWLTSTCIGIIEINVLLIIISLSPTIIFFIVLLILISKLNTDYYEDVLKTTEYLHHILSARKEGKIIEAMPRNIKVKEVGINKGKGASVFYYKHLRESKRAKIFIFDTVQIVLLISTTIFAILLKKEGLLPIYIFSIYLGMLSVNLGRWIRELNYHYLYLIPVRPFTKLIMILLENFQKIAIFTFIQYLIVFLITQAPVYEILSCAIGYFSFNILFTAVTILTERVLGQINSKTFVGIIYLILILIIAAPGIILGVIALSIYDNVLVIINISAIWNFIISLIVMFCCRNLLGGAEIKN
ncbi:MAG TPA: putative ABC exporter domain-containing protein [Bacilli bacterium]